MDRKARKVRKVKNKEIGKVLVNKFGEVNKVEKSLPRLKKVFRRFSKGTKKGKTLDIIWRKQ